jgi:hypothetical protein
VSQKRSAPLENQVSELKSKTKFRFFLAARCAPERSKAQRPRDGLNSGDSP